MDGTSVRLEITFRRFRCSLCARTTRQNIPGVNHRHRMTTRLLCYLAQASQKLSVLKVATTVGLNETTIRTALSSHWSDQLDESIDLVPQILGVARVEFAGKPLTVFWDVGTRTILGTIASCRTADVERWLAGVPEKERIRVVVTDLVAAYRDAALKLLPDARPAVHHSDITRQIRLVANRLRSRTNFNSFSRSDPHYLFILNSGPGGQGIRPKSLLEVNPFLARIWEERMKYHEIWRARNSAEAYQKLEGLLNSVPSDIRRAIPDIMRLLQLWKRQLATSADEPALLGYAAARRALETEIRESTRNGGCDRKAFAKDDVAICEICDRGARLWPLAVHHEHAKPTWPSRRPRYLSRICKSCARSCAA
ncbi:transposase [Ferirhizobium litorale]|nr:transposase [Fererhizobium litorale]